MEYNDIKEADGYISATADNWLVTVNNSGKTKVASISFVKYVAKHTISEDLMSLGTVKNTMEVMGTFSLSELTARELVEALSKMLDAHNIPSN